MTEEQNEQSEASLRDQMEEARKTLRAFQELQDSTGWGLLAELMDGQIQARVQSMRAPSEGMDGLVKMEFLKGEIAAFELIKQLPVLAVQDFQEQYDELLEALKDDASTSPSE